MAGTLEAVSLQTSKDIDLSGRERAFWAFHRAGPLYLTENFKAPSSSGAFVSHISSCGLQTQLALPTLKDHSFQMSGSVPFCVFEPVNSGLSASLLIPY